jgi:hypothetical protein
MSGNGEVRFFHVDQLIEAGDELYDALTMVMAELVPSWHPSTGRGQELAEDVRKACLSWVAAAKGEEAQS